MKLNLKQVLAVLENVTCSGKSHFASCPNYANHVHNDASPALKIDEATDGTVLVNCKVGCDQATVWELLTARIDGNGSTQASKTMSQTKEFVSPDELELGGMTSSLAHMPAAHAYLRVRGIDVEVAKQLGWGYVPEQDFRRDNVRTSAIAVPHYVDEKLVGLKYRSIRKYHRINKQIVPSERGKRLNTQIDGSEHDGLYGVQHLDPIANYVLVVEGPEDHALAMTWKYNTVSLPSASSKVSNKDIAVLRRYRTIYLLGDQDLPGKKAMDSLQEKLTVAGSGNQIVRPRLPGGHKDISELWAAKPEMFGKTLYKLLRVARATRNTYDPDDLFSEGDIGLLSDGGDDCIVEKLIVSQAINGVWGEEKSGKSLLIRYVCKCIVNGVPVFGKFRVMKRRPVWYFDLENPVSEIEKSSALFRRVGPGQINYRTRANGRVLLNDPNLIAMCEKYRPVLVFDSLTKLFEDNADFFGPGETSTLMNKLLDLCAAGATVIFIHHTTRDEAERYANSHQIGANVSRGYAVISRGKCARSFWLSRQDIDSLHFLDLTSGSVMTLLLRCSCSQEWQPMS